MPLNVPDGSACFIDTNIFYYHFTDRGELSFQCTELLGRVTRRLLSAATSLQALSDAVHKIMMTEASTRFGLARAGLSSQLHQVRRHLPLLTEHQADAREFAQVPFALLEGDGGILRDAVDISTRHSLLTNDSVIVALMQRHGIEHLVTNDDDFDAVPGITVWKPR